MKGPGLEVALGKAPTPLLRFSWRVRGEPESPTSPGGPNSVATFGRDGAGARGASDAREAARSDAAQLHKSFSYNITLTSFYGPCCANNKPPCTRGGNTGGGPGPLKVIK
eukprot:77278-Prorocentrum_minimum.AAC.1